jgi:lincosamide nucleotidyltransferase
MQPELLLNRLDEIARSLERSEHALALIGLGSVGLELDRLDAYSDLDFFVIVEPGHKQAFLADLGWLSATCAIAYCFANTQDGYKVLFSDGIFCEFAVFEPDELQTIPFSAGRIVWKQPHISASLAQPAFAPAVKPKRDRDWLLGEALTNLFVGMAREKRGEKLSAMRFIQGYAVDRVLELAEDLEIAKEVLGDPFALERRFERRYPGVSGQLPAFLQGYERNCESALAILDFLEQHFAVNREISAVIRKLCAE